MQFNIHIKRDYKSYGNRGKTKFGNLSIYEIIVEDNGPGIENNILIMH